MQPAIIIFLQNFQAVLPLSSVSLREISRISHEADRLILGTGASWFTNRQEQQALLDFMTEADRCSGWPRDHALQALMDEWDW